MFVFQCNVRVHYALTDKMGFVYHGNYAQFYEIGRTEALRSLGFTYKNLEEEGVLLPVVDMRIRFLRPAVYDDFLTIVVQVRELPHNQKIVFHGEIFNEEGKLLNTSEVTLFFMKADGMQRMAIPPAIQEALRRSF